MNDDMNLAAWMIAGGPARPTFADERTRAHVRALSDRLTGPRLTHRVAALLGARRPAPALAGTAASARLDAACCAA